MKRRTRGLRPDEAALWQRVADQAEPLFPKKRPKPFDQKQPVKPARPLTESFQKPIQAKSPETCAVRADLLPTASDRLGKKPITMDRRSYGKMVRGKLQPEGRIDLHGMTLAQAHPALTGFILSAHACQKRLVLVITGKGKTAEDIGPIPVRRGVLKHHVPQWLAAPPLSGVVLQVTQAHKKHGGEGALYVYLRRQR